MKTPLQFRILALTGFLWLMGVAAWGQREIVSWRFISLPNGICLPSTLTLTFDYKGGKPNAEVGLLVLFGKYSVFNQEPYTDRFVRFRTDGSGNKAGVTVTFDLNPETHPELNGRGRQAWVINDFGEVLGDPSQEVDIGTTPTLSGVSQPEPACVAILTDIVLSGMRPNLRTTVEYQIADRPPMVVNLTADGDGKAVLGVFLTSDDDGKALIIKEIKVGFNTPCPSLIPHDANTVTLRVNHRPTATLSVVSGNGTVCANDPLPWIKYTLTGTGPWVIGRNNAPPAVSFSNEGTFQATGAGTYQITSLSDANCEGIASDILTVAVNPLPAVSLAALAPKYCPNASALTPGTPTGGTYRLDGGPPVSSFDPATLSVGHHTVVYTYTDGNGCTASVSQGVEITQPVITDRAMVSGGPVCAGQAMTLSFGAETCGQAVAFTAQLSDAVGNFEEPVSLGPVTVGNNQVVIPPSILFGTGYRIRVVGGGAALDTTAAFRVNALGKVAVAQYPSTPGRVCQGEALPVSFATSGICPFPLGNAFAVQLSNATGSFANPTVLSTNAQPGTTSFALPGNLPPGTGYRIRIVSSSPAQTSYPSLPFRLEAPSLALTPGVAGAPVCRGSAVSVSFQLPAGCPFPQGNGFTAQLSSASGSFASPVNLGAVLPGVPNSVTIPANSAAGTGYRIRTVSSNPALTSNASISFRVNACASRLSAEAPELVVSPNPVVRGNTFPGEIRVRVSGMDNPQFSLATAAGRSLGISVKTDGSGEWVLTPRQALPVGMYVLQATEDQTRLTQRVLVVE